MTHKTPGEAMVAPLKGVVLGVERPGLGRGIDPNAYAKSLMAVWSDRLWCLTDR
jgi:hypothetical protein